MDALSKSYESLQMMSPVTTDFSNIERAPVY